MTVLIRILIVSILLGFALAGPTMGAEADKPILIGGTTSLEGQFVEPSKMGREAFRYWVEEINQKGGLLGRPVKLILYDDKSKAENVTALYRKLLEEDKVDLLISPYSTPLTIAASKVSEEHDKLLLGIAAASEKPWKMGARNLFQLYAPASRQFVGMLDIMARKNYKTVSLIYNNKSVFNVDIAEGVKTWAKKFNIDVIYEKAYQNGKEELPAIMEAVRAAGAHGLINSSYPPDSYELLRILENMGYQPKVLGMPIVPAHPEFRNKVGEISEGIMGPSQWEPDERIPFPGTKEFIDGFRKFTGFEPSFHAASAYSGCQLIQRAAEATQTLDNSKLRDYIASLDTVTVLGRFKVDQSGLQVGHNSFLIQWQDGKKEIIWPRKMRTAHPRL